MKQYDNLAKLRLSLNRAGQTIYVKSHTTEGDGGGGEFWLDTSDTSTADDNGINIVDSVSPRIGTWKRLWFGPTNAAWFGVTAKGTEDDTAAIQAAINSLPPGGILEIPAGKCLISSTLTCFVPGASIRGLGALQAETTYVIGSVLQKATDFHGLVCSGYNIEVRDLTVLGQPRAEGSGAGVGHGIVIAGRGSRLDRVVCRFNGGCGVLVNAEDSSGTPDAENTHYGEFNNGFTEYNGQAGFRIDSPNSGKMNLNLPSNWTSRHNDGDGFDNQAGSYQVYEACDAEYNLGYGMRFAKGSYTTLVGCHTEQNEGGNGSIDAGDGVLIEDGVIQLRFIGGTYGEGGGGSDFEIGISYAAGATQQNRDARIMKNIYKNRYTGNSDLSDMHFEAYNYRNLAGSTAGIVGTVMVAADTVRSAAFYAERMSGGSVRAKISSGTAATPNGVEVIAFDGEPSSGDTAMLLLVNDAGVTEIRQVSMGVDDSGGVGYKVLRVPN